MLYVTTRTDRDAFTAYRAMTNDRSPDGGQFLPLQMPRFSEDELRDTAQRSFNENIAHVLNLLYRTNLTGRDIELVIGDRSARLLRLNSRTMAAEIWRDADGTFEDTVRRLFRLLVKEPEAGPGQWFAQSVRIAMLVGICGELMAKGVATAETPVDLAVPSFDFQAPMAAWYARSWGLPIGTIICACNENNAPWSLIHQGEMRTDSAVRATITAACDQAVPAGLERLISATLGTDEVRRYLTAVEAGRPYNLTLSQQEKLRAGLSVCVISRRRMEFMLPNIYCAGRWNPDPYAAMAYAALVDHRSRAGETGKALVIAEENPVHSAEMLAGMLNTSVQDLRHRLERS